MNTFSLKYVTKIISKKINLKKKLKKCKENKTTKKLLPRTHNNIKLNDKITVDSPKDSLNKQIKIIHNLLSS